MARESGRRPTRAHWRRYALAVCLVAWSCVVFGPSTGATDSGQADLLASHPGFFDLDSLGLFVRDELNVHISVKGPLLALVAAAARESDSELAAALGALQGIEVRVYDVGEGKRAKIKGLLEESAGELTKQGWQTAITIQVNRDHGYALLRFADDSDAEPKASEKTAPDPVGLLAMYLTEDNEAVFVNIVGRIDTATVGRLSRQYDLDLLAVE